VPLAADNAAQPAAAEGRRTRWSRVAACAAKQSGSNYLVEIAPALEFDSMLQETRDLGLRLICHTDVHRPSLRDALDGKKIQDVLFAVGPEGGFSTREIAAAEARGCSVVKFPTPTLRVETAAVFALSVLRCEFGGTARR
jgi:16S rRNA (uracil1498-N3)-methyltransferase